MGSTFSSQFFPPEIPAGAITLKVSSQNISGKNFLLMLDRQHQCNLSGKYNNSGAGAYSEGQHNNVEVEIVLGPKLCRELELSVSDKNLKYRGVVVGELTRVNGTDDAVYHFKPDSANIASLVKSAESQRRVERDATRHGFVK